MPLAHIRRGSGEPMLLVHGLGSRRQIWDPVLDVLALQREVVAIDLPGFGESPVPAGGQPRSVVQLTASVRELLDDLGWERPHVAGHSLGGGVALELGHTGRARTVTAVAPVGFWTRREALYARLVLRFSRGMARALDLPAPILLRAAPMRSALLGMLAQRGGRIPAAEAVDNLRGLGRCPGFGPVLNVAIREPLPPGARIDCPVTIAWPRKDRLLVPRQAERAGRMFPSARLVWLEGCGHSPFYDDREAVTRVLLEGSRAAAPE